MPDGHSPAVLTGWEGLRKPGHGHEVVWPTFRRKREDDMMVPKEDNKIPRTSVTYCWCWLDCSHPSPVPGQKGSTVTEVMKA